MHPVPVFSPPPPGPWTDAFQVAAVTALVALAGVWVGWLWGHWCASRVYRRRVADLRETVRLLRDAGYLAHPPARNCDHWEDS